MFKELCGKNAFQNVILTTTMWDKVDEETGEAREKELKSKYWQSMLERGSTTGRFMRTRESAFTVIEPLIDAANERSSVLLQKELVDMGNKLSSTSAGRKLVSELEVLVRKRQDILRRIRNEMKRTDGDEMTLKPLQEEHQRLRNSLEAIVSEMRRLKLPLGHRLLNMTDKFLSSRFMIYDLRPSKPDYSPSNIDTKVAHTASMTDSYVSGPQNVDPESEENYPLLVDNQPRTVVENSTHQLPTSDPTSRTPLPNDCDVLPVNGQGPGHTGFKSQAAYSTLRTTEGRAQNSQNKTTSTTNHLSSGPKPPPPTLPAAELAAHPPSKILSHRIDAEAFFCPQEVRDLFN